MKLDKQIGRIERDRTERELNKIQNWTMILLRTRSINPTRPTKKINYLYFFSDFNFMYITCVIIALSFFVVGKAILSRCTIIIDYYQFERTSRSTQLIETFLWGWRKWRTKKKKKTFQRVISSKFTVTLSLVSSKRYIICVQNVSFDYKKASTSGFRIDVY